MYQWKENIQTNSDKSLGGTKTTVNNYTYSKERDNQRNQDVYWKDIEQNYHKAKKHRVDLKRKIIIQGKQDLPCEITQVADNDGANRGSYPNLLLQPF
jgi:hypothetical protein